MLQRELKVAFSTSHQPIWVRVLKWVVIVALIVWQRNARYFWQGLATVAAAALLLHFFYRYMTRGWTRAWGGWNDVESVNK